jgi:uncharacterized protein
VAIVFFDSSALVKRYVAEAGSQWVTDMMAPFAGNTVHISVVSGAEVVAAIVRRQRSGGIMADEAARAIDEFSDDWSSFYELVRVDREVINRAMLLAQRYGLRGYDAVQLASALEVDALARRLASAITVVSADEELNAAAVNEGLVVANPNSHP